ncbi:MAG: DUF4012 domain-containing protein [Candidatus Dormibacteria bacterium]
MKRPRPRDIWVGVSVALLLLVVVDLAWAGYRLRRDLVQAQTSLAAATTRLHNGLSSSDQDFQAAEQEVSQGRAQAAAAHGILSTDPGIALLGALPVVRTQVLGARNLGGIAFSGADALDRALPLLRDVARSKRRPGGSMMDAVGGAYVAHIDAADHVLVDLEEAVRFRRAIPAGGLVAPLRKAVDALDRRLPLSGIDPAVLELARRAAPKLFGVGTASNYLLVLADNAELRPNGGFLGSFGTFGFDSGRFSKPKVRDIYLLEDPLYNDPAFMEGGANYLAPPKPLQELLGAHSLMLRDACWSPDWPTDARQQVSLFEKESGSSVDGVVQVDPSALAYLLQVTGPIDVPDYGERIDSSNLLLKILDHTRSASSPGLNRKAFLGSVADIFLTRVTSLPSSAWPEAGRAVQRAIKERHIFALMKDPALNRLATVAGMSGDLPHPGSDGLLVAYANLSFNKTDYWMERTTRLTIDGSGKHHLELHLSNKSPGYPGGRYRAYVRFYLPPDSTGVGANGLDSALEPLPEEGGWKVAGGYLDIAQGNSTTIGLDYVVPGLRGPTPLLLVKENGITGDQFSVEIAGTRGATPPLWAAILQRDTVVEFPFP